MDFQNGTAVHLGVNHFISLFEDSIVVGGGQVVNDVFDDTTLDTTSKFLFARSSNPFDFTVAGAGSPTLNFVQVPTPEKIQGFGIYTNTSGTAGPIQQLVVGKKNSSWVQTSLSASGSQLINLSSKAGLASDLTIVNTPIGTLMAAVDNVYLLRGNGEPTPVGNEISRILERSNLQNAVAGYHDQHYKLSFYDPDLGGDSQFNNVEWWLDIRKMKAQRGQSSWKGPMVGRSIDYAFVEDFAPDGISYESARDRLAIDKENLNLYKADVLPGANDTQINDFTTAVTWLLETKDFDITRQDNNWNKLVKRQYWKLKTNNTSFSATEQTFMDGVLQSTQNLGGQALASTDFDDQPLRVIPVFVAGRARGRTVRKTLTGTGRVGIGGFSILYQIERRRI